MNADSSSFFLQANEDLLKLALIQRCALTDEAVASVTSVGVSLGLRFSDAALRLGFVTQEDIDAVSFNKHRMVVVQRARLKPCNSLTLLRAPLDPHSESLRSLRTELLLRRDSANRCEPMVVMSPCSGEGRSQLAAELAIAYSQLGQATLLVDADLRRPRQHSLFGADNRQGLSDAIELDNLPFLHPVEGLPHLSLLTAGQTPGNPLELLCSGRFEKLIDEWRRNFSYIVFDTPPVDQYSDGLAVATLAGKVLALCRAEHTPVRATRNMLQRLSSTQSSVLGAVVNRF